LVEQSAPLPNIASPLTLIRRAAGVERRISDIQRYEEALMLSYTVDFGFLDTAAVPMLRSIGARVTAVGDVTMADFDPHSAPHAGRAFNSAYAQCGGAFHPKVFVLASDTEARIAIGSGNATIAGWSYNHELWTVVHSSQNGSPTLIPALARWLELLPSAVRFSAGVERRLINTAELLNRAHSGSAPIDTGDRLIDNLEIPIIDQLPIGPVDELCIFAPFFDVDAAGVVALLDRLRPREVTIAAQPGLSRFDGEALVNAVRRFKAQILLDNAKRYRHGKLVEWATDGARWALTGSANISRPALLRSQSNGGNCELGLISQIPITLMPTDTTRPTIAEIRTITVPPPQPTTRAAGRILGAHLIDGGLRVELLGPLGNPAEVQYSATDTLEWQRLGTAPVDCDTFDIACTLVGSNRLRLVTALRDTVEFSNVVAIVDLAQTTTRRSSGASSAAQYSVSTLFTGDLLTRLLVDLQTLRGEISGVRGLSEGVIPTKMTEAAGESHDGDVEAYTEKIGLPMLTFALGKQTEYQTDSSDGIDDVQLDDDSPEDGAEDLDAEASQDNPIDDLADADEQDRKRYRRWARRAVDVMPQLTTLGRLAVTRLITTMLAARIWGDEDTEPVMLLVRAVGHLAVQAPSADIEASVGSLAAVALAILDRKVQLGKGTEASLAVRTVRDAVAYLLSAVDPDRVATYLDGITSERLGFTLEPEDVIEVANQVVQHDDVADALRQLINSGREVYRPSRRTLHVIARTSRPDLVALEAVSYAENTDLMAAWCSTPNNKWALVLWKRPDFVVVSGSDTERLKWQHFQTERVSLKAVVHAEKSHSGNDRIFNLAKRIPHRPWVTPDPLGEEILRELGLSGPNPPSGEDPCTAT
jgi:hypothetical protein